MKKISIFIVVLFLVILLSGCIKVDHNNNIPLGKLPTKEFTVGEYIQNDAIFQASSTINLTGTSEEGVVIVATLYDYKNNVVSETYCTTDSNGKWMLTYNAPDPSIKSYTIKIKDSNELYHKTFNDIRFGETWLVIGDNLNNLEHIDNSQDSIESKIIDYNKMFFKDGKWIPASAKISAFGYDLIENIISSQKSWYQYPVGIVFATEENTNIYEWLSYDLIDTRNNIKEFIVEESINLLENSITRNDASNLYNKYSDNLINMSYANVILNQGIKDFKDYNTGKHYIKKHFRNIYTMLLYSFVSELIDKINFANKIYFIQDSLMNDKESYLLRKIQSTISSYYNKLNIIPTYDLCLFYDVNEEIQLTSKDITDENFENVKLLGYNYKLLTSRIFDFDRKNIGAPMLDHIVQEYDEFNNLVSIKLIFENVDSFNKIKEIIGLKIYDENNELVKLNYSLYNNEITINLERIIEEETVDNSTDTPVEEELSKYVTIIYISYGYDELLYNNNLESLQIPVIPFDVVIN